MYNVHVMRLVGARTQNPGYVTFLSKIGINVEQPLEGFPCEFELANRRAHSPDVSLQVKKDRL